MMVVHQIPLCDASPLRGLFAASAAAEGSLAWFHTLAATTLAPHERALVAVVLRDGEPVAGLPLAVADKEARTLTAPYTTRYVPALADTAAAAELGRMARAYATDVLRLEGCDAGDPAMAAFISGLKHSGLAVASYQGFANWYEPVAEFDSWWAARPSRVRSTVRRKLAAAERAGLGFVMASGDEAIAHYEDIYRQSWKEPEPHPQFIPGMIRALGREGLVRVGLMMLDGRAVAAQIWLVCRSQGTIFKLAHREDAATFSPGTLLTWWMAKKLIEGEGVRELDFGRGDDAYKRDWLSRRRTRTGVIAADWRSITGLSAALRDVVPTLGTRVFRKHMSGNRAGSAATEG